MKFLFIFSFEDGRLGIEDSITVLKFSENLEKFRWKFNFYPPLVSHMIDLIPYNFSTK